MMTVQEFIGQARELLIAHPDDEDIVLCADMARLLDGYRASALSDIDCEVNDVIDEIIDAVERQRR